MAGSCSLKQTPSLSVGEISRALHNKVDGVIFRQHLFLLSFVINLIVSVTAKPIKMWDFDCEKMT